MKSIRYNSRMVTHVKLQYYRHKYGLVFMTGLLGCRWHRYKQSTRANRKRDYFWFTVLLLTFLFICFYLYYALVAANDYDDINQFMYRMVGYWVPWYTIFLGCICAIFAYFTVLMLLSLCHVVQGHQLYIHLCHIVFILLFLAACIALTVTFTQVGFSEWAVIFISLRVTAPFIQIGAVVTITILTWIIVQQWFTLSHCGWKLLWLFVYITVMCGLYITPLFIESPCVVLEKNLPPKPKIFAHRGASGIAPENTVIAFSTAANKGAFGVESDVHISYDGIPFLLHDRSLKRTTNIAHVFPNLQNADPSSLNISQLRHLNAGSWFLEMNPHHNIGSLSDEQKSQYANQTVALFSELLQVVKENELNLMFDVNRPHADHPFYDDIINRIVEEIINSSVPLEQIYWLISSQSDHIHNNFTLVSKELLPFATLKDNGIRHMNLQPKDISLKQIDEYKKENISIIIYMVDTSLIYSLYWCAGVDMVTSNMVHELNQLSAPVWHLPPQSYLILWVTIDGLSAVIVITIFIVQRIHLYGTRFSPETLSLNSHTNGNAFSTSYRARRSMKEKLLMKDVTSESFESEPDQENYIGIESNYTVQSTDGQIMAQNYQNESQLYQAEVELAQGRK
ncbi:hypothetical protein ACJMK2_018872 [Sinanodonta woodiana]|uniref:GP-PDE domain-containing protein n=1 Tax=Sinanodonta woodiana TaxID=1069815 RepID=A0ABD3UEZ0_SINWO